MLLYTMSQSLQLFKKKSLFFISFMRDKTKKYESSIQVNSTELTTILEQVEFATENTPRLVANNMTEWLSPYIEKIIQGDEDFLTSLNLSDEGVDDEYLPISESIRDMWNQMSKEEKDELLNYFRLILTLGVLATRKESMLRTINSYRAPNKQLSL